MLSFAVLISSDISFSLVSPFSEDYLKLEGIKRIADGRLRCFGMFDVKGDSSKISTGGKKDSGADLDGSDICDNHQLHR